jgi:hypothetical protein
MTLHEANAVMWYLRNNLFFDLHAHDRRDVLLVKYEDLIANPQERFVQLFDFVDVAVPSDLRSVIRGSGSSKRPFPDISPDIRVLCEELQQRLLAHYAKATAAMPFDTAATKDSTSLVSQ